MESLVRQLIYLELIFFLSFLDEQLQKKNKKGTLTNQSSTKNIHSQKHGNYSFYLRSKMHNVETIESQLIHLDNEDGLIFFLVYDFLSNINNRIVQS